MHILVIAPGWPSKYRPSFMPFFYEQVKNVAKEQSCYNFTILIPINIIHYFRVSYFKSFFKGLEKLDEINSVNVEIKPIWYLGAPKNICYESFTKHRLAKKIRKIIGDLPRVDIVHCHFLNMVSLFDEVTPDFDKKIILTEHTSDFHNYLKKYGEVYTKYLLSKANKIIAVSASLKATISEYTDKNIEVIPNGVDCNGFKVIEGNKAAKKFVFIGHLSKRKGVIPLVKAFKQLLTDGFNVELSIIGKGELEGELLSEIHGMDSINLIGAISNSTLKIQLPNYDCLILPSEGESFGVVVIEANACGLPVIVTRCGGPENIITDDSLGLVIDNNNTDLIYNAVIKVTNNVYDKDYIRRQTLEKYDWKVVAREIVKLY